MATLQQLMQEGALLPTARRLHFELGARSFQNYAELSIDAARECNLKSAVGFLLEAEDEVSNIARTIVHGSLRNEPYHESAEALREITEAATALEDDLIKALTTECGCRNEPQDLNPRRG